VKKWTYQKQAKKLSKREILQIQAYVGQFSSNSEHLRHTLETNLDLTPILAR
jgi:hypothetical protein